MRDTIGIRQQLSTTSFEAFELEITVNYFSVYTWIENNSFMQSLTFWLMFFGLSSWLSTRFSTATHCTRLADFLQHTVDASLFPTLVEQFTECCPCTILLSQIEILIRMTSSCEMLMILFNFCWYVGLDNFTRQSSCTKQVRWEHKNTCRWLIVLVISVPKIFVSGQF